MTVYEDALWTEASHDHEAAHDAEIMGAAQVAGAEVFSVLASAEHEEDFYNRLALMHDRIHAVASSIAPEGTPDYTRIVTALPERYFADWHLLAEARRKESQARNAPRAAARAEAREQRKTAGGFTGGMPEYEADTTEEAVRAAQQAHTGQWGQPLPLVIVNVAGERRVVEIVPPAFGPRWSDKGTVESFFGDRTFSASEMFATAAEWAEADPHHEAKPMDEVLRGDPKLEVDPVTWDEGKKKAALWPWERTAAADDGHSDANCAVCHHPLWWNPDRKEYVHRGEYGDQGHKPEPMEVPESDERYYDEPQPYPYYNASCPNCGGDHQGQCPYPWFAQHDASKKQADPKWCKRCGSVEATMPNGMCGFCFNRSSGSGEVSRPKMSRSAAKRASGDNSWPPKEGGEKEGGDPKAPPAAPGAPQVPEPTATEQAQPGQPGTPASGITQGTVLLDAVDGMVATYEVNSVTDEGETMLVSVTKNGGEQMDLRIPKTEMVQTYQAKGDDAAAPVEQPEGTPSANPFADKAAADGEANPEGEEAPKEGEEKPAEGDKPKDDEDDPEKKKGNPFA